LDRGAKQVIKTLLPNKVIKLIGDMRNLSPSARAVYLKLHLSRALGMKSVMRPILPAQVHSVLFVCNGNILRSPMAAELLRKRLADSHVTSIAVHSAGIAAAPGRRADPRALEASLRFGVSLENHRTQPVTAELISAADVTFVMDYRNEAEVLARAPEVKGRVLVLGTFDKHWRPGKDEISDPYGGDVAEVARCYETIQACVHQLASILIGPV
jgi:protein-tyrosine phosphatase